MASTRATTGNSKPRVHMTVSTGPERQKRGTTTGATKRTTAPKKTAGTSAGVKKPRGQPPMAAAHHHKRKPHLSDKIEGAAEKVVGKITRKPGKKAAGTKKMRGTDGKNSRTRNA
ncbi:Uu.00g040420.m01.CDS01 [Anthostomella pinea]|uniref:Uu.00g040420.m01.CDS01 n=1 Tax=Anthostomella pinea TaxID=933095 RepID=A0AAI8VA27_9PEZI|nr:Uu.00g040420.m01.CDS01 [Anthostomella pinea]